MRSAVATAPSAKRARRTFNWPEGDENDANEGTDDDDHDDDDGDDSGMNGADNAGLDDDDGATCHSSTAIATGAILERLSRRRLGSLDAYAPYELLREDAPVWQVTEPAMHLSPAINGSVSEASGAAATAAGSPVSPSSSLPPPAPPLSISLPTPAPALAPTPALSTCSPRLARTLSSVNAFMPPPLPSIPAQTLPTPVRQQQTVDTTFLTPLAMQIAADAKVEGSGIKYFWDAMARRSTTNKELSERAAYLRSVLLDVKPPRSKWYDPSRIHQEELYLAFENVLRMLINFKAHSWPFIQPVSKKIAKDYDLIVKRPMALETMQSKMKMLHYQSKQEFVDDLELIINNCYQYNGIDPANEYVRHANAMKRKIGQLVPKIPDLIVRDRTDHDSYDGYQLDYADGHIDGTGSMANNNHSSTHDAYSSFETAVAVTTAPSIALALNIPATTPATFRSENIMLTPSIPTDMDISLFLNEDTAMMDGVSTLTQTPAPMPVPAEPEQIPDSQTTTAIKHEPLDETSDESIKPVERLSPAAAAVDTVAATAPTEEDDHDDKPLNPEDPVVFGTGYTVVVPNPFTAVQQDYLERRRSLLATVPFPDQVAITPSFLDMAKFYQVEMRRYSPFAGRHRFSDSTITEASHMDVSHRINAIGQPSIPGSTPLWSSALAGTVCAHFPELSPGALPPYLPLLASSGSSEPATAVAPADKLLQPVGCLNRLIYSNIGTLRDIRLLRFRIENDLISPGKITLDKLPAEYDQQLLSLHPLLRGSLHPSLIHRDKEPPQHAPISDSCPPLDDTMARFGLSQSVALLLQHTGFEAVQSVPLDTLTDVVGCFFARFGQVFHSLLETTGQNYYSTADNVLMHSLQEIGMKDLSAFESFWRDSVVRYRQRLLEVQRRLELRWLEVNGADANTTEDNVEQDDLANDDIALLSGNFSDDFGLDFLGLEALGMGHLRVPSSLLNPNSKRNLQTHRKFRQLFVHGSTQETQSSVQPPSALASQEEVEEIVEGGVVGAGIAPIQRNKADGQPSSRSNIGPAIPRGSTQPVFGPAIPFQPITSIDQHIGLLRPLLLEELASSAVVVEDVDLPSDQRLARWRISRELNVTDTKGYGFDTGVRKPKAKKRAGLGDELVL